MSKDNFDRLRFELNHVFTPGAPIAEKDLFAGRVRQMSMMLDAISKPGQHAVLFGERGVGKTSLANVLSDFLRSKSERIVINRINCEPNDTYNSLWRNMLRRIVVSEIRQAVGFANRSVETKRTAADGLPKVLSADDIRRVLEDISQGVILILIFDEFDRIRDLSVKTQIADTIKMLSDFRVTATVVLIGVADSVDHLIAEHQSVERALVQIPMPRMSPSEIGEILSRGLQKMKMEAGAPVFEEIKRFSQGLPYVAHLLALHSSSVALTSRTLAITAEHVAKALKGALDQWQQSTRSHYYQATKSPQPGHMYREVLLACALAVTDEFGFFSAADVRAPLRSITGKKLAISSFSRHLRELSSDARGDLLQCVGETRRYRYRFSSPLMRPYIIMRSFADGLAESQQIQVIEGLSD